MGTALAKEYNFVRPKHGPPLNNNDIDIKIEKNILIFLNDFELPTNYQENVINQLESNHSFTDIIIFLKKRTNPQFGSFVFKFWYDKLQKMKRKDNYGHHQIYTIDNWDQVIPQIAKLSWIVVPCKTTILLSKNLPIDINNILNTCKLNAMREIDDPTQMELKQCVLNEDLQNCTRYLNEIKSLEQIYILSNKKKVMIILDASCPLQNCLVFTIKNANNYDKIWITGGCSTMTKTIETFKELKPDSNWSKVTLYNTLNHIDFIIDKIKNERKEIYSIVLYFKYEIDSELMKRISNEINDNQNDRILINYLLDPCFRK